MSRYTQGPCPACNSSDAYTTYEDGSYCYSCGHSDKRKINEMDRSNNNIESVVSNDSKLSEINGFSSHSSSYRNISPCTYEKFGVKAKNSSQYYPYTDDNGNIIAYKERQCKDKKFFIHGNFTDAQLFGQSNFTPGGFKLVITEGELDCMSVSEAFDNKYPVVSIPSATGNSAILRQRDWIRSFKEVILWFDNDEPGQKITEQAAKIIGYNKVKVVRSNTKDANDMLMTQDKNDINKAILNAIQYSPAGVLTNGDIWEKYEAHKLIESIPYPTCLSGLNDKLKGMRQGEITLFTSGTGSGKSTVIKEILYDLVNNHEKKVGLASLEESIHDTVSKFLSMNDEDEAKTKKMFKSIVLLDHQGSVGDSSLIDQIEVMALMGCTHIVLDHITIAVSEGTEGLEGNAAIDKVMSDLLKIVKKHNIWLGLVSHLRKAMGGKSFEEGNLASIDDIKGSGSIKQISFDIIAFARNLVDKDDTVQRTVKFRVLKSRFTGLTGDAGSATYNRETTRLEGNGEFSVEQTTTL